MSETGRTLPCDRYEVTNGAGICVRCGFPDDQHQSGRSLSRERCPACGDRPLGFGCPEPQVHLFPERFREVREARAAETAPARERS